MVEAQLAGSGPYDLVVGIPTRDHSLGLSCMGMKINHEYAMSFVNVLSTAHVHLFEVALQRYVIRESMPHSPCRDRLRFFTTIGPSAR